MTKADAPNLREVSPSQTCFNCDHYDHDYSWCDKYDFSIRLTSNAVCDDWKEP